MDFIHKKYELGVALVLDVNRVQADLARSESRLAAFDAGLVPPAPAGVRTQAALEARAQYRALLQKEVDFAATEVQAAQRNYNLGKEGLEGVTDAQIKVIEAKLKLAALDAGLEQPPNPAARQPQ